MIAIELPYARNTHRQRNIFHDLGEPHTPRFGLTMTDMGAITAWAFQLSYALFQVPAGMFGERFGARIARFVALLG